MNKSEHFKPALSKCLIIITAAVFSMGFSAVTLADENAPVPRILVSAQGSVDIAPDMALLSCTGCQLFCHG